MNPPENLILLTPGVWIEPSLLPSWLPGEHGTPEARVSTTTLAEDHPMWDHASGGDRNTRNRQWRMEDLPEAAITLAGIHGKKAGAFFSFLQASPGELFTSEEIVAAMPDTFASPYAIAGSLNGFRKHCERADRVYPFYWWEGTTDGAPTRYAIRPSVAAVFAAAAHR